MGMITWPEIIVKPGGLPASSARRQVGRFYVLDRNFSPPLSVLRVECPDHISRGGQKKSRKHTLLIPLVPLLIASLACGFSAGLSEQETVVSEEVMPGLPVGVEATMAAPLAPPNDEPYPDTFFENYGVSNPFKSYLKSPIKSYHP